VDKPVEHPEICRELKPSEVKPATVVVTRADQSPARSSPLLVRSLIPMHSTPLIILVPKERSGATCLYSSPVGGRKGAGESLRCRVTVLFA
jgi:hypothetical protein